MRVLGNGGPEVSVVGLGTNNFGGRIDYEQSLAVIDAFSAVLSDATVVFWKVRWSPSSSEMTTLLPTCWIDSGEKPARI